MRLITAAQFKLSHYMFLAESWGTIEHSPSHHSMLSLWAIFEFMRHQCDISRRCRC
jgi:hypothetical protein